VYKWIIAASVAVILGVLAAYPTRHDRGLHLCNGAAVHSLDPARMSWMQDIRVSRALREGLTTYDPDTLRPAPGVASGWEISEDGLTYTFHLRPEARWSNGDPVVAGDFLYAWKRAMHPALSADYTYLLWTIRNGKRYTEGLSKNGTPIPFDQVGVKAADDHTLIVTLQRPCGYFLDLTGFSTFEPVHPASCDHFRQESGAWDPAWTDPENLVCNGAYVLAEHLFQQRLVLKKNPHYWDAANVRTEELVFEEIEDPKAALLKYEVGEVDVLFGLPATGAQDMYRNPRRNQVDFFVFPAFGTYFYRLNCARPPLNDKRVRQALAMATDKQRLVEVVTRMGETPTGAFVAPGVPGYRSPPGLAYDPARARALLEEAGFPGGAGLGPVEILFNTSEDHSRIARAVGAMWKENLGVEVKLTNQESKVAAESQRTLRYVVSRSAWFGDYGDANTFLDMFVTGGGNNDTGYANPQYDRLISQAADETDAQARIDMLQRAEAILLEDAPIIPLYHYVNKYMVRPSVKGVGRNPRGIVVPKYLVKE
jgi:oligopeptide transport system substrate-binding protein